MRRNLRVNQCAWIWWAAGRCLGKHRGSLAPTMTGEWGGGLWKQPRMWGEFGGLIQGFVTK